MPKENAQTLSQLIKNVADELRKAKTEPPPPAGTVMRFKECEIELNVKLSFEGSAGLRIWVIEAGGKGAREAGHTIRLKFSDIEGQSVQFPSTKAGPATKPTRLPKAT